MIGERRVFPDGLIRVTRGQRGWGALVEVETSAAPSSQDGASHATTSAPPQLATIAAPPATDLNGA